MVNDYHMLMPLRFSLAGQAYFPYASYLSPRSRKMFRYEIVASKEALSLIDRKTEMRAESRIGPAPDLDLKRNGHFPSFLFFLLSLLQWD